jgi:L-rhamnose 1-dehydrogenase
MPNTSDINATNLPMRPRLSGKVALVTGATRGIGQACAIRLAAEGAIVAINHRPSGDPTETLVRIESFGGKAIVVEADLLDAQAIRAMVAEVARRVGPIELLVNNAGICEFTDFFDLTELTWDRTHAVNLRAAFVCSQAVARVMVAERMAGSIVSMSSISAWVGGARQVHYTPTKAGISSLMKSLAVVLGPYGIRCNSVLPGAIETDINRADLAIGSAKRAAMEARTPIRRVGDPEDVAGVVAFLCSDDARFMTGSDVLVDGGLFVNLQ